jgi:Lar family restriction alleviation protein
MLKTNCSCKPVILPCPFCGAECSIHTKYIDREVAVLVYRVQCNNSNSHYLGTWNDHEEEAIKQWNARYNSNPTKSYPLYGWVCSVCGDSNSLYALTCGNCSKNNALPYYTMTSTCSGGVYRNK